MEAAPPASHLSPHPGTALGKQQGKWGRPGRREAALPTEAAEPSRGSWLSEGFSKPGGLWAEPLAASPASLPC